MCLRCDPSLPLQFEGRHYALTWADKMGIFTYSGKASPFHSARDLFACRHIHVTSTPFVSICLVLTYCTVCKSPSLTLIHVSLRRMFVLLILLASPTSFRFIDKMLIVFNSHDIRSTWLNSSEWAEFLGPRDVRLRSFSAPWARLTASTQSAPDEDILQASASTGAPAAATPATPPPTTL